MKNQHFGVQLEYLIVLFATMQLIKMFLRTSYGVSERFCTGSQESPFQGAAQGSGDTPPIWLILSVFIFFYLCDSKLVPFCKRPMSLATYQIAAPLHADDADLVSLNNG